MRRTIIASTLALAALAGCATAAPAAPTFPTLPRVGTMIATSAPIAEDSAIAEWMMATAEQYLATEYGCAGGRIYEHDGGDAPIIGRPFVIGAYCDGAPIDEPPYAIWEYQPDSDRYRFADGP